MCTDITQRGKSDNVRLISAPRASPPHTTSHHTYRRAVQELLIHLSHPHTAFSAPPSLPHGRPQPVPRHPSTPPGAAAPTRRAVVPRPFGSLAAAAASRRRSGAFGAAARLLATRLAVPVRLRLRDDDGAGSAGAAGSAAAGGAVALRVTAMPAFFLAIWPVCQPAPLFC